MKRLTISKVDTTADRRRLIAGISVTAAAAATVVVGTQKLVEQIRSDAYEGRLLEMKTAPMRARARALSNQMNKRAHTDMSQTSDKLWDTPLNDRPVLAFNKGEMSQMLDISGTLFDDSPAAAIALMDFIVMQRSGIQPYARARLTTLLQQCNPRGLALRSAQAGVHESQQSRDGRLTVALCRYELAFLQRIFGEASGSTPSLVALAEELQRIIGRFKERDSQRRQGAACVILADVLLRLGRLEEANWQMSRALVLLGTVYHDRELMLLAVNLNGPVIIDETFGPSSDEAQQTAYRLVDELQE